jgi:hypothetical protein
LEWNPPPTGWSCQQGPLTTSIYISISTYRLSLSPPLIICMCRWYWASTGNIRHLRWNPPPAGRSHQLSHLP